MKDYKKILFDMLIEFGFTKMESDKFVYFRQNKEVYVFPNRELQLYHYYNMRIHLDMNGWINEEKFNEIFKPILKK